MRTEEQTQTRVQKKTKTEKKIKEKDRELDQDKYNKLDKIINEYKSKEGSLITVLHQAQKVFGYLPREVLIYVSKKMGIPFAEVYGVVSFYSLFTMKQRGKYTIEVCMGTACYVKGSEEILNKIKEELGIEPGEVTDDGLFTIETTRCKGACSLAPVVAIGDDIHSKVTPDSIKDILSQYSKEESKEEVKV